MGLLNEKPSSGYDLRKMFSLTPMKTFSDSPGTIYPALRRLQRQGMVQAQAEAGSKRRRQSFKLTRRGTAELKQWLVEAIERDDVVNGMQEVMLRFAFLESALGIDAAVPFLQAMERELESYVPNLRKYLKESGPAMPSTGHLALESGIRGYEAQLQWARYALAQVEGKKKRGES